MHSEVVTAIGQHCPKLHTMHIFYATEKRLTDEAVRVLLQGCPLLQETDVIGAVGISHELRVELVRRRIWMKSWL